VICGYEVLVMDVFGLVGIDEIHEEGGEDLDH
jgi:hypothetical protein